MNRYFRSFMFLVCAIQIGLALGFIFQIPFVVRLWPLSYTNPISFIFIGSIFAAAAASTVWCLATREHGALAGVALDYLTILTPSAIFLFQTAGGSASLQVFGVICALGALFGLGLLLWSRRFPIRQTPPMPRLVHISFAFFVIALVFAGGQLVLKRPGILPWDVMTQAQVLYGWFFLGAAAYFAYAVLRPSWHNAGGQLAGFLAYDMVLIIPFLNMLPSISPARRLGLIVYIIVVSYSGLLAFYYLFINAATRLFAPRQPANLGVTQQSPPSPGR